MSFELIVMAYELPADLRAAWEQALADRGIHCRFHPMFEGANWSGGFLPITIESIAPGSFPAADRYVSATPFVCGFELDVAVPRTPAARQGTETRRYFSFRTASGRSVADLRLQCFGAATLAIVTFGAVEDPQQGATFKGERALANAAREADEYEAKWATPEQWVFSSASGGGEQPA